MREFQKSSPRDAYPDDGATKNGRSFAGEIPGVQTDALPNGPVERSTAFKLARDPNVETLTVCAAIMAWDGMQENFRDSLFGNDDRDWLNVAEKIRSGHLDRKAAYGELKELRRGNGLTGAGPAYFTKLIYFLMPCDSPGSRHGYIMDQCSVCSINLLLGRELVRMDISGTWNWSVRENGHGPSFSFRVTDGNTPDIYEQFCCAVDRLADQFSLNAKQVDRALVSAGGPNPEPWRRYVKARRLDDIRGAFGAPGS